jgi:hypothetical protein
MITTLIEEKENFGKYLFTSSSLHSPNISILPIAYCDESIVEDGNP